MTPERQRLIRLLFDEYIEMYAARDPRLIGRFSENFSGFSGSSDKLVKTRAAWIEITLQDFRQVPDRIRIDVVDVFPQELRSDVLAVTAFFHIHLPKPDPLFARETARLVLVFSHEGDAPTPRAIALHVQLMDACDLRWPIILSADGGVMDGMHRVAQALRLGHTHIAAQRFALDPAPDHIGVAPQHLPY